ncbi:MAG TPA: hypothetical protein VJX91_07175 [Candidatus Eisenbacteria bacterium]|nr:hypothetical protein [Candidatus Eisenbacteria bacterium]
MAWRPSGTLFTARLTSFALARAAAIIAATVILVASNPAFADLAPADSMIQPTPAPSSLPASEPFRVQVKDGEDIHATFVGSWWNDYVRIVDGWGHVQFVHATRVIAIFDSTDQDVTHRVLDSRAQLGARPAYVAPPRVLKAKIYRSPLSANIAQGSFFGRTGSFDDNQDEAILVQVDVGNLWKIGNRDGLGFSVFGSGDKALNAGVKVWGRRLLRRDLVVDVAPGVVLATNDQYSARDFAPAFLCETALTYNSWLSLAGQVMVRDRTSPQSSGSFSPYSLGPYSSRTDAGEAHTEWAWYFGVKLGGYAAAPAMFTSFMAAMFMQNIEAEQFAPSP